MKGELDFKLDSISELRYGIEADVLSYWWQRILAQDDSKFGAVTQIFRLSLAIYLMLFLKFQVDLPSVLY